ncbi:MAG: penicillin acylase family protein [Alphaproteobacteria bacterium]|nr:penicillin acylase family protein [Alphaproteobacteria bacterium]
MALFGILPALGLVCAGAGYLWLRTSLPLTEGRLTLEGPRSEVDILRDRHGIPHIRAQSMDDAYFALGFVHAQDRMWQMEMMRRLGTGRLAEMAGRRLLPHDRALRTLGVGRLARDGYAILPAPVKAALEAYARGVNAWIKAHSGALPPEFYVAGISPAPWDPTDSLIWGRLLGLRLSANWRREALRARLLGRLTPEQVAALWPPYPAEGPVTVPTPGRKAEIPPPTPSAPRDAALDRIFAALDDILPAPVTTTASNSWAVSGSRTQSGKPIVAGDPHLGFEAPNLWYLARVSGPGLAIAGATLPGVPFHVLGHNGHIGWTLTTTGADTQDLVIETLAPGDDGRYLTADGPRRFATRTETVRIRGETPVQITVRATRNGPVVSDLTGRVAVSAPPGRVIALKSAALSPADRTAEALYLLNRARNWTEFRAALRHFHSPVQNFIYGDAQGHIGFQIAGRIPIRKSSDGFVPVRGDRGAGDWIGFIPFDRLPSALDPAAGTIVNANNRAVGTGYPYLITRDWDRHYRARRIEQLLGTGGRHAIANSAAMQMDNLSLAAREMVPILVAATPAKAATAATLERLRKWDGQVLGPRAEPLIFHVWMREIVSGLVGDDLGPLAAAYRRADPAFIRRALETETAWCDDVTTPPRETCGAVLDAALDRTLAHLRRRFGTDPAQWRWDKVHIARFRNRALSILPVIGRWANIEVATDGDTYTLNRGTTRRGSRGRPFAHVHGATYRAIYDFADLDRSRFMQPTGQSGNPLSPHYRDLIQPWRNGQYVAMPARPSGPLRRLTLRPAKPRP